MIQTRWTILTLALALLAGSVWISTLAAQTPKPPAASAPKPEEGDDDPEAPATAGGGGGTATTGPKTTGPAVANRAAIDALIDQAGKEPPAWWNTVKLTVPPTLDLAWPLPAPPPWNANKNISQYYISIINPNPARHQEGCKLMHHILTINKDKPVVAQRAQAMLGRIYAVYLQDYARGAYWFRKAKAGGNLNGVDQADLAYCYFRLGSREMALAEIAAAGQVSTRTVRVLGILGEVDKALDLGRRIGASYPEDAYLGSGDACRFNGRFAEAIKEYQKVLALKNTNPKAAQRLARYQARATANIAALKAWETVDLKKIPDGTYRNESIGYRGPIKVDVTVKATKITQVKITATKDDWPLNATIVVPAEIINKQSVKGVDMVSGATFTAEAILNATGKALSGATK